MIGLPVEDPWAVGGILILAAALVLSLGGMGLVLYSARMTREAVSRRVGLIRRGTGTLTRSVPLAAALIRSGLRGAKEREQRELVRLLSRFGVPLAWAAVTMIAIRMVAIVVLALLGFIAASHFSSASSSRMIPLLVAIVGGGIGWFLPMMIVRKQMKKRTKAIVTGLPDALELLVICVQAGLSFEDGIDRVAAVLVKAQPALAEELALTSADMKILPSRDLALANLAGRVDTPSVRSVVTTLSQTLRYGTPLAQALRVVSGELRNDTIVRLEERANQLPTLMTIPMMLFIMPTIFMVVAGPAALRVIDSLKH
jgi:tight adherence protein C